MVFHWEARKYKFSGKDSRGSKSLTQLAVSPSRASCCYLFKSWSFLWMFSNSLTITGRVSRCKCLSGPLLPHHVTLLFERDAILKLIHNSQRG